MKALAALLVAGGLHALAFAPGPLPAAALAPLQLLTLACLAAAVWRAATVSLAAWRGFAFGVGNFAIGMYWLFISLHVYGRMAVWLSVLAVLLLSAGLALFTMLAAALARWLAGRPCRWTALPAWAAAWAGTEWLRGTVFTGLPWLNIGYGHVDSPLAGFAPLLGVYGVAFAAALAAGAIAMATLARGMRRRGVAVVVLLATVAVGAGLQRPDWGVAAAGEPLAVRLVQGNVEQSNKFDPALILSALERHLALAAQPSEVPGFTPDLVVLPETAIPLFQDQLPEHLWQLWIDVAAYWQATLATGIPLHTAGPDGTSVYTNSVVAFTGEATPGDLINGRLPWRYDKAHLVPFGEFIPYGFRWFVDAMVMPLGDFNRGASRQQPFAVAGQHVAFNVCYEDVFGEELLPALRPGPDGEPGATILANVTNLGWFGDSRALPQHLQIARMRSLETARPSIRATNTGVTAVIDGRGRVLASLPSLTTGVLDTVVQGTAGLTPYARWGNAAVLVLILAVLLAGWAVQRRNN